MCFYSKRTTSICVFCSANPARRALHLMLCGITNGYSNSIDRINGAAGCVAAFQ